MRGVCRETQATLFALCFAFGGSVVHAQAYPDRPIRLILPFTPGGNADIVGRIAGASAATAAKQ